MSNFASFQAQLGSIVEILAKAAVAEINRCVDDSCAVFRLEISQSQTEIETLKHKLQILEREVMETRRQKTAIVEHPALAERVVGEEWRSGASEGEDRAAVREVDTPLLPGICGGQLRPDHLTIKQESLDEDLWCRVKQVTSSSEEQEKPTPAKEETRRNWKKPDTKPTPVGDQEKLREQHRCGHGDVELSGLEFVVKEEHVAQRLNQTESEHSAERLSNQSFEYEEYERDNQRWASCTQGDSDMESDDPIGSNAMEQYSQSLPMPSALQLAPSVMKVSGNTLSIYGASYVEEFDKMGEELSVRSEELRSEAIHTQQGQYRVTVTESPAQPHSGSQYDTGSAPSTSVLGSEKRGETDGQASAGKKLYICISCGKSFTYYGTLINHQRVHSGEKPYSCTQCGQCFNRKGNLVQHERVHSGYRPFGCTQCGKRFARGTHLREHQRIHTRERPHHCTQCGRSFTHRRSLLVHLQCHSRATSNCGN